MASFVKVAKVADVPEGSAKLVEAGGKQIALFNAGGKFYAIDNTCKHRGGPLAEGELDGTTHHLPMARMGVRHHYRRESRRPERQAWMLRGQSRGRRHTRRSITRAA